MNTENNPTPPQKKRREPKGIKCPYCDKGYITFVDMGDELLVVCSGGCPSSFVR